MPRFLSHWTAEALRLREAGEGLLDDAAELPQVLQAPPDLPTRILRRAELVGARIGLAGTLRHWSARAQMALFLLWALAFFTGIGTASAALGAGAGPVNLALALLALLGVHVLTFLMWLASFLPGMEPGGGLSSVWLWATGKLTRGADRGLPARALVAVLDRARAWRHLLGGVSHSAWLSAFTGVLLTLVLLLSTRRYTFQWETTLLSPDAFVWVAQALGALPAWLGFATPDAVVIARSDGQHVISAAAQADWSSWLIGCVVVYGLLPRLLAGLLSMGLLRRAVRRLRIDPALPGWLELADRLMPTHQRLGIDAPAPALPGRSAADGGKQPSRLSERAILAFEPAPDTAWPPAGLPADVSDLGVCDSRDDRHRVLQALQHPPARLLVACDARQTPDRGTRGWLAELQAAGPELAVLLLHGPGRTPLWASMLADQGIALAPSVAHWLAGGAMAAAPAAAGAQPPADEPGTSAPGNDGMGARHGRSG